MNNLTDTQKFKKADLIAAPMTRQYNAYGTDHQQTVKTQAIKQDDGNTGNVFRAWLVVGCLTAAFCISSYLIWVVIFGG